MKFFVPGKTFLVGEYSVLVGGAALGLATRPFFEFDSGDDHIESDSKSEFSVHPESPAGLYLRKHNKKLKIKFFKDQYAIQGALGGFGKSTAEYFAAIIPDLLVEKKSFFEILKEYRSLHEKNLIQPSGIDLAFQFFGNVTLADPRNQFFQTFDWNFSNLDFFIISTSLKISTHEHLAGLNLDELKELPPFSEKVVQAYSENNEVEFIYLLNQWCELLNKKGLTHLNSFQMKKFLEKNNLIKLVKPCGALGADVLLVFFNKDNSESVKNFLFENKINIQAHSRDLVNGFGSQLKNYWSEHVG